MQFIFHKICIVLSLAIFFKHVKALFCFITIYLIANRKLIYSYLTNPIYKYETHVGPGNATNVGRCKKC